MRGAGSVMQYFSSAAYKARSHSHGLKGTQHLQVGGQSVIHGYEDIGTSSFVIQAHVEKYGVTNH